MSNRKEIVSNVIKELLSCSDGKYITEIYAKDGSIKNGEFTNWISIMIETDTKFVNESLYDCMDDIEERIEDGGYDFRLILSIEPDTVERGHGTVLWKKGDKS